ncbi:MAG: hypothetical protein ABFD98_15700 [Syntrophobacteraceae bacterium]|nr:hypothetical protein [Desulfobacteraceae bacterium]
MLEFALGTVAMTTIGILMFGRWRRSPLIVLLVLGVALGAAVMSGCAAVKLIVGLNVGACMALVTLGLCRAAANAVFPVLALCALLMFPAGCGKILPDTSMPRLADVDLLQFTKGGVKAVTFLQGAAKLAIGIPCKFGLAGDILDEDVCALYEKANQGATIALKKVNAAIAKYEADPSADNAVALTAAKDLIMIAWSDWNEVNGKKAFVDSEGNLLDPQATSSPAK